MWNWDRRKKRRRSATLSATRTADSHRRKRAGIRKAGFSLIEVLVATFILALVVATVNMACKQYLDVRGKMRHMENIYLSALSLKDYIESGPWEGERTETGRINGLDYRFTVTQVIEKNNFVQKARVRKGTERGPFSLKLFRVDMQLAGRTYAFLSTRSASGLTDSGSAR